ncbi:MAG: phosphoribosylaminoimidazole-succinocarboxamide synthase [Polyangiales bacterium]|jgi:phosphoribosylaminoimidazole-succinocarboxamide synthase
MSVEPTVLRAALEQTLQETHFEEFGTRYEGKVRDSYTRNGERTLVVTDRISAFDRVLGTLPFKGQVLNSLAAWWFDETKTLVPNHCLDVPDPNVMVGIECSPLPVEMVMRAHLTGVTSTSIWHHYENGGRHFCGHALPDGLQKHQALDAPILTPSTKAAKGDHDISVSRDELLAMGHISERDFDEAAEYARLLFEHGRKIAADRGLMLVDTKYEFGKTPEGRIIVIDEIHTPDSSRYWEADTFEARMSAGEDPQSLDKEYVRRWLKDIGYGGDGPPPALTTEVRIEASRRYIEACERVSGAAFVPNTEAPISRIRTNLNARVSS